VRRRAYRRGGDLYLLRVIDRLLDRERLRLEKDLRRLLDLRRLIDRFLEYERLDFDLRGLPDRLREDDRFREVERLGDIDLFGEADLDRE